MKFVFNGSLFHFILLREVEERQNDMISFKLLGDKVFIGWKNFDIIMVLRYRPIYEVQFEQKKALRLRLRQT